MAARAIWKGVIRFKNIEVPVKLYSAVQDRDMHFRMLHDQDMTPVNQQMVNPSTNKEVPLKEAVKGAPVEPGVYVLVHESDLKELEPKDSRDITIERFVPNEQIDHQWYERPYYLGPDSGGQREYWALRDALKKANKEGLARWFMRKREYIGSLTVSNDSLMLVTMRFANEVGPPEGIERPAERKASAGEVRIARQLVEALQGHFDPSQYRDEYRSRVLEYLKSKARGKTVQLKRPRRKVADAPLKDLLSESLKRAKQEAAHA